MVAMVLPVAYDTGKSPSRRGSPARPMANSDMKVTWNPTCEVQNPMAPHFSLSIRPVIFGNQ